jgi:preprotein translocase subunit SecA
VYEKRKKILLNDQEFFDAFLKEIGEKTSEAAILVKDKQEKYGEDFTKMMRAVLLQIYDVVWMDHLEHMENLRESVRLRSYGQRDPLVEYKREGLTMYKNLDSRVQNDFINFMMHMDSVIMQMNVKETQESKKELINSGVAIGRNDACPCNSGKKVKKCDCKEYAYLRN